MAQRYELAYTETALAFLEGLNLKYRRQIVAKIERLATEIRPPGCKLVQGVKDGENPVYRIRQGDYRVLYVVRESAVVILDIDHRKDIYR